MDDTALPLNPKRGLEPKELDGYDFNYGYTLIPLHKPGTIIKGQDRTKTPFHSEWQKFSYERMDPVAWMKHGHNIGVRLDYHIMVIDADPRNYPAGDNVLKRLLKDIGLKLKDFPYVNTGGGGYHLYTRLPVDLEGLRSSHPKYPGIDFKTNGQVVAAGSVHPNGNTYRWGRNSAPLRKAPRVPGKLIELLRVKKHENHETAGLHTPEQLAHMLSGLNPCDYRLHVEWLVLMMACHHATAGDGIEEFVEWSTSDWYYARHGNKIRYRWDSLSSKGTRNITYRTLYKILHAKAMGRLIPPATTAEEDFGAIDSCDLQSIARLKR